MKTFSDVNDLFLELSKHLEFVPFLNVFVVTPDDKNDKKYLYGCGYRLEILSRLSNYNNYKLAYTCPPFQRKTTDMRFLSGYQRRIYHQLIWAEKKLYYLKRKKKESSFKLLNGICDFLLAIPESFLDVIVMIDEDKLYNFIEEQPKKVRALQSFYNLRLKLLIPLIKNVNTKGDTKEELKRMIEIISLDAKNDTSYIPNHPLEISFDRILNSPILSYGKEIDSLVGNFKDLKSSFFIQELFSLAEEVINDLKFDQKQFEMSFVLLLYRCIFNKCYDAKNMIKSSDENAFKNIENKIIKELGICDGLLPPHDPNCLSSDLFLKDHLYKKAVACLETSVFFTNPMDILNTVDEAIHCIEEATATYGGGISMLSFESSFVLFIGVLCAARPPEWRQIVDFVREYAPPEGLAPRLEYALANMEASIEYLI